MSEAAAGSTTTTLAPEAAAPAADSPEAKAAAEKAAADATAKAAADKAAADKAAADAAAAAQSPEAKAAAEKAAAEAKAKAEAGAPEKYEAFRAPAGVALDEALGTELGTLGKELNLSQDKAQRVFDLGAKFATKWNTDLVERAKTAQTQWHKDSLADKEFGGEAYQENLGHAQRALKEFGTPEFTKLLVDSGLQKHPEVLRTLVRVGKAMAEDKFVKGGAANDGKSAAEILFPKSVAA